MFRLYIVLVITVLIGADQLTKWLAVMQLQGADPITVIPGVLSFAYTENTGAAWSMFSGQRWLLVGVTSLMIIGLLAVILSGRYRRCVMALIGGSLVIAGGVGNLIDRLYRGYVVDFIRTDFMSFPIFNLADCFVVIGAIMLFIYFVFIYSDEPKKSSKKVAVACEQDDTHRVDNGGGDEA